MKMSELDALHARIAKALGWKDAADCRSFSLSALQELVRTSPRDPKLYHGIAAIKASGRHLTEEPG